MCNGYSEVQSLDATLLGLDMLDYRIFDGYMFALCATSGSPTFLSGCTLHVLSTTNQHTVNAKAEILTGSWVDDLSRISGFVEKISSSLTAITLLLSSPVGCLVETFWRDPGTPLDAKRIGVEMTLRIYTIGMGRRS